MRTTEQTISEIRNYESAIEMLFDREMASGRSTRTERDELQAKMNALYAMVPDDAVWGE
jgi:hypothetical protein